MFSWSSANRAERSTPRGTPNAGYPGTRTPPSNSSPVRAQAINGSIRPPDLTRAQHIESYLNDETLKRSTRRVSADDSTYDTVFQTTKGDTLIVRIHLPQSGNRIKAPAMTMAGVKAKHPWLDSRMRITGYSPIANDDAWRNSRLLLGQAVDEVVKHLQLEPPQVLEITDSGLESIQSNRRNGSTSSSMATNRSMASAQVVDRTANSSSNRSHSPPPEYSSVLLDMPTIPQNFEELDALSREELDKILEDELEFSAFVNKLPILKAIQSTANDILDENVKKAEANLEKMEQVKTGHKKVTQLKNDLESKLEHFKTMEQKQDSLCAPPDVRDVLRQFARGKKEAFQQSEQMAEEWVDEGGDIDAFMRDFIAKRTVHHIRAAKMERLQNPKNV